MPNNNVDPQLMQVLELLGKFGFKFFGYNENKEPLVIAENGQVVTIAVAYNFVQTQIAKASAAASLGGMESMPQMPQIPNQLNMPASPENKIETRTEQGLEKQNQNFSLENLPKIANPQTQQQSSSSQQASVTPFGDGFKVTSFDPGQVDQAVEFVKKNSKLKQTSPKKYLALQFEKFLSEIKLANKK